MKVGSDGRSAPSVVADQTHSISVLKNLEAKSRKFDVVVTCNDSAIIPSFTAYPELRPVDYCGKHSLIHAPTACVYACIEQYLQCKGKDLCNTSACILVPAWEHAKFRDLLNRNDFVAVFSAGRGAAKYAIFKRQARFHQVKVSPRSLV